MSVEAGKYIDVKGVKTHYHEDGQGEVILLIHGSGPGVSAWANWRLVFPILSQHFHLYAPDVVGFGYTDRPERIKYSIDVWADQMIDFVETIGETKISIIGNSFGGAIALNIAKKRPDLIKRLILMGSMGIDHQIYEGLDRVWGYTPSFENMKDLIKLFTFNQSIAENDDLVEMRYRSSMQEGFQESFSSMFPRPRQQYVSAMALSIEQLGKINFPVLLIHGRDDRVIPLQDTSYKLALALPNAELHVFPECGHWVQIEKTKEFAGQVIEFLKREEMALLNATR
ncbi:2-hydroxymuconate-semialdehyde hydrolase [Neobacillus niacini]|uniref:alpha/beta fold hydrolase n=1 Tax=Neobacillus niacini TaxID=86668 RepID=UPI0028630E23|nr:alpha/beta hydrolase [Neobacillus niacini]MDR7077776.1 2-hydroxymuconate-semialdehyde hydrolase [Neobacillus niacini]